MQAVNQNFKPRIMEIKQKPESDRKNQMKTWPAQETDSKNQKLIKQVSLAQISTHSICYISL
jgi:hypothetical protein